MRSASQLRHDLLDRWSESAAADRASLRRSRAPHPRARSASDAPRARWPALSRVAHAWLLLRAAGLAGPCALLFAPRPVPCPPSAHVRHAFPSTPSLPVRPACALRVLAALRPGGVRPPPCLCFPALDHRSCRRPRSEVRCGSAEEVRLLHPALSSLPQERLDRRTGWFGVVRVTFGWGLDLRRPDHHGAGSYWWRCPIGPVVCSRATSP